MNRQKKSAPGVTNEQMHSGGMMGQSGVAVGGSDPSQKDAPTGKARPSYQLYEQMLVSCFEKIRKTVPRKSKELKDLCGEAMEQVKADADDEILSANKYFRIMKLALDTKNARLTEHILYHVQKLVAHGLMDGNHPDDCLYPDDERPRSNGLLPRKLIDAIVDEVCKCTAERDQQVQLQVLRALLTLVATRKTEVHEKSLLKVLSSLYYIHIASTNSVNQNTARASLIQMIKIVFNKMESTETQKRLNSSWQISTLQSISDSRRGTVASDAGSGKAFTAGAGDASQEFGSHNLANDNLAPDLKLRTDSLQNSGAASDRQADQENLGRDFVNFSASEQYAHMTLTFIVDNVCLHAAKQDEVKEHYQTQIETMREQGVDEGSLQKKVAAMKEELDSIPMAAVPRLNGKKKKKTAAAQAEDTEDKQEREKAQLNLVNEQGIPAGKFGWCVACRNTANLYCKHTRHPVCSFECKQNHIKMLEEANEQTEKTEEAKASTARHSSSGSTGATIDEPHTKDALLVFNKLCQLLQNPDLDRKLDNVYDVRKVLLGLDLIHSCLEHPGQTFTSRREFVSVVRDHLCTALIKFAASSEHKIFARTVSIFHCLFLHFREHLKQSIGVFIDNFFLSMLDSVHSEYDYKYSILEFFDRLSENPEHILEIFANFDCDVHGKNICLRIVDTMSKIAKSDLQRNDGHGNVVTPQQENSLRRQALEIVVKILRNMNRTIEATVEMEAQARAKIAERREQRALQEEEESTTISNLQAVKADKEDGSVSANEAMDAKIQMQNLNYKSEMSTAAKKFNLKAKTGLKYLTDRGYLVTEPRDEMVKGIVRFLKTTPALGVTAIGSFLGENKDLNKEVLSVYIHEFDWTSPDIDFVMAMKEMLQGFRIPGEGQIVDRIFEIFGEKLAKDRPDEFGNAEGVFLFSYAILMVQTSIHNPQAQKCRMSLADFKKITSTVKLSNTNEIDFDAYRGKIYERIEREPFTLEEDEEARMKLEAQTNTNKKQLFDKEREVIMRRGKNILKTKSAESNTFMLVRDTSTVLPMFENTWQPYLAVFSFVMEQTEDPNIAGLCLQGFIHAIRISGHYQIHDVRDLFVSSLSKFTQVNATREIRIKNINCIRGLLNLAIKDGEILRDSWKHVLDCISKIDSMRALGLGDMADSEFFKSDQALHTHEARAQANQQLLMRNSAIIAEQIDSNQIDQIFLQSEKLNTNAIIDFIENLCKVSREELQSEENPKKFCLQKLVEVASLNMHRVRFQWQTIWQLLGDHFTHVGSHKNLNVVIYAIDSLRQLSDKFLEKDERRNFSYQKMFLKPFETIMLNNLHSSSKEIKEYVVMCIAALCNQKAKYIRSGWEVILYIFTLAAQDTTERHLVDQSFRSIDHAVTNHFGLLEESFIELVNCLSKFARNGSAEQTTKVLQLLQICADRLRDQPQIIDDFVKTQGGALHQRELESRQRLAPAAYGIQILMVQQLQHQVPGSSAQSVENKAHAGADASKADAEAIKLSVAQALWFPILRNFTGLMMDKNKEIRESALDAFIETLYEHHSCFGEGLWREIFGQVLLPMLEDIRLQVEVLRKKGTANNEQQILDHVRALEMILDRLNGFFVDAAESLGPSLMACYTDSICLFISKANIHEVADVSCQKLGDLLLQVGNKMEQYPEFWSDLTMQLKLLHEQCLPRLIAEEMKNYQSNPEQHVSQLIQEQAKMKKAGTSVTDNNRQKFEQSYAKSAVQLQLTFMMQQIVPEYFDCFTIKQIEQLLLNIDSIYKFAIEFNSEINLRQALWQRGYMAHQQENLPGLLELEEQALKAYLSILFKQYQAARGGDLPQAEQNDVSRPLFALCSKVLKDYVLKHSELVSINEQNAASAQGSAGSNEEKLAKLRPLELKKQLQHLSPTVHQVILENLLKLSDPELNRLSDEIGQLLIDLTLCDDSMVRQKNHKLLTRIFEQRQQQKY